MLKNSQIQKEELLTQEEELRQNLEEMQTTHDNMQRAIKDNEEMQNQLEQQKIILHQLLKHLSEKVYCKDREGLYLNASKSLMQNLNIYDNKFIVGKTDTDFLSKELAAKQTEQDKYIMDTQTGFLDKEIENTDTNGNKLWLKLSKIPIKNNNDEVVGMMSISKDITEKKVLENKLSDKTIELNEFINLLKQTTYTTEYDANGIITDVNQCFANLLQIDKNQLIGQSIVKDFENNNIQDQSYTEFWDDLQKGIYKTNVNYININSRKIWLSETYIPIFNANNELANVLKIAFDITTYMDNMK